MSFAKAGFLRLLPLALAFAALPATAGTVAPIVINEVDYDQDINPDGAEFIEIKNVSGAMVDLSLYEIVYVNGSGGGAVLYNTATALSGMLAPGAYYVVCGNAANVPNCNLDVTPNTDWIQNGSPDAVAIRLISNSSIVDTLSYEGNTGAPYTENTGISVANGDTGATANRSNSRCLDGVDSNNNSADFILSQSTPGAVNQTIAGGGCVADAAPTVLSTNPTNGAMNVAFDSDIAVAFSEPVTLGNAFTLSCGTSMTHAVSLATNDDTTFSLDPDGFFAANETCTLTVVANQVQDQDGTPNNMAMNFVTTFTTASPPTISMADASVLEGNSGTKDVDFAITLSGIAPFGGVRFDAATSDNGSAVAGTDYVAVTQDNATIPAGFAAATFTVPARGDTDIEGDETFTLTLSDLVNATAGDLVATGTITNDDAAGVTLNIVDATKAEGDTSNGSQMSFLVQLSAAAPMGGIQFNFTTSADPVGANPATAGADYTSTSIPVNIPAGNESALVDVPILDDMAIELSETFLATVSNIVNATPGDTQAVGTITDNDNSIAIGDASATEGDAASATVNATFTVTSSVAAAAGGINVTYMTSNGSASAPGDYTATMGSTTIAAGATTATVDVPVRGDLTVESSETFTVTISSTTPGVAIGDATGTGTITDNGDGAGVTIASIQGDGTASPVNGQTLTVLGSVVTGVVDNGFFMQMPVGDGNLDTSDAMFVYTSSAPAVAVGNVVDVRGTIKEAGETIVGAPNYSNLTKFTNAGLVVNVTGTGAAQPAAFGLDSAMPSPIPGAAFCAVAGGTFGAGVFASTQNFECLESMRVTTPNGLVLAPRQFFSTDMLAEQAIRVDGPRTFREPGVRADLRNEDTAAAMLTPPAPPLVTPNSVWDGNPEAFEIDADRLVPGLAQEIPVGSTFAATGVLGFEFGGYELFPTTLTITQPGPTLPIPVPAKDADQLTIASANVLHLYNATSDPGTYDDCAAGTDDECPTPAGYQAKLNKVSSYIRTVLGAPMVVALQEVENTSTLTDLVNQITLDTTGAISYTGYMGTDQNNDPGHINNAFLVRSDVTVDAMEGLTQFLVTDTWTFNGSSQGSCNDTSPSGCLHNRTPLLLRASTSVGGSPVSFAVLVVHLRSLLDVDVITPLANQQAAHRARQKRLRGAVDVAELVQSFQTLNPNTPLVVVGDFNAFEHTDGYADVVGIIRGDYVPTESEYPIDFDDLNPGSGPNGNIVVPKLEEGVHALPPADRYSYIFGGHAQVLDHALLSRAAVARYEAMAFGRGNAEGELALEAAGNTAVRTSDHDGVVIYLNLGTDPTESAFELFEDGAEN